MTKTFIQLIAALSALLLPGAAQADEKNDLIAQMVAAHGGERLLNLSSYVYQLELRDYLFHGGRRPDQSDMGAYHLVLAYDGARDAYSLEQWWYPEGGEAIHHLELFDAETYARYDFRARDYRTEESSDIDGLLGVFVTRQPPLLVRQIAARPGHAEIIGEEEFYNRPHTVMRYAPLGAPVLTLYIDNGSHRITKAEWTSSAHQVGLVTYFYADYVEQDGILIAQKYSNKGYGRIYQDITHKNVQFNVDTGAYFRAPDGFRPVEIDDLSEMSLRHVAPAVAHVGSGLDYTVFFDLGEEIVAYGARRGLAERLAEYRRVTGNRSPLRRFIVDHHHADHLWGLNEFAGETDLQFIVAPEHAEALRSAYEGHLNDDQLISFREGMAVDDSARFRLLDISTRHSEHNLMVYLPAEKTLVLADHIFVDGRSRDFGAPYDSMRTFVGAIDRLDLDIERYVTIHNSRIFTDDELRAVLAQDDPELCYQNRPICADKN